VLPASLMQSPVVPLNSSSSQTPWSGTQGPGHHPPTIQGLGPHSASSYSQTCLSFSPVPGMLPPPTAPIPPGSLPFFTNGNIGMPAISVQNYNNNNNNPCHDIPHLVPLLVTQSPGPSWQNTSTYWWVSSTCPGQSQGGRDLDLYGSTGFGSLWWLQKQPQLVGSTPSLQSVGMVLVQEPSLHEHCP